MARSAHLDAVSVSYETANVGLPVDGGAAVAAVFEIEREPAVARANAALAIFETEARNAGISYGLRALTDLPAEAAARREFEEELGINVPGPLRPLGYVRQRAGKTVHAFALEGTLDVSTAQQ